MCHICKTQPVYEFTNKRKLCRLCFIKWFEKKFLFINRKFNLINKNDIISIKKDNSYQYVVLKYLLENFKGKLMIKLNKGKAEKIAVSDTIDDKSSQIFNILINKHIKEFDKINPIDGKIIKPLYLFTDEEVLLYAELKGLRFKTEKQKKNNISQFLENLEKKHPEVKRAVVNGYLKTFLLEKEA